MKIDKIEHIGIAVRSIEESMVFYEGVWGFKCNNLEEVVDQKVRIAFLKVGDVKIEQYEPTYPKTAR